MESFERLASGLELRREGRRIIGPALLYGDVSPSHREKFAVGAFRADLQDTRTRWLDTEHRLREAIAFTGGGGLTISEDNSGVYLDADIPAIPAGDAALSDVALKRLNGLSVEFRPVRESQDQNGIRIVHEARVNGFGLVGSPSYPSSTIEVRARSGRSLRSNIPTGKRLGCRCSGSGCKTASFTAKALDGAMTRAFKPGKTDPDVIAAFGDYSKPLASVSKKTLRRAGGGGVVIDLPGDEFGSAVESAAQSSGVILRPFLDASSLGKVEDVGDGLLNMAYSDPDNLTIRSFIVSASDERQGWPTPRIGPTSAERSAEVMWQCL